MPDQPALGRVKRFDEWRRRLTTELVSLPDTLQTLREGAAQFELVGRRLVRSSEALDALTRVYDSTLADSTRRSADALDTLRAQIDALAQASSPERLRSATGDLQRTLDALADLNPFWPKSR